MPDSFTFNQPLSECSPPAEKRKVLVTGAAGNIGSYFAIHSSDRYDLRLMAYDLDDPDVQSLKDHGEVIQGDITDLHSIRQACEGIDTVIHLAGNPSPNANWSSLRDVNIGGTYNTMVAAKAAGCRRVIFASSIHAVSGYPPDRQVMAQDPVNPGDLYGVSKAFGEAMGRYMAEQQGLSVIAIRICAFQPLENAKKQDSTSMMDAFVSQRDLTQLLCKCIDDTRLRYAIVHGISDNVFKRLDLAETTSLLGFQPQDDLSKLNPLLRDLDLDKTVNHHDETGDDYQAGIRDEIAQITESS
jgi:nucleoside-diphosphate-sugar epimerase